MTDIQKLIDLYFETISSDHHKDKDRYFSVGITYKAYEQDAKYYASHDGYIDEFYDEYASFQDAYEALTKRVKSLIKNQLEFSTKVNACPQEYDVYVLPQQRVEEIRKEVFGD